MVGRLEASESRDRFAAVNNDDGFLACSQPYPLSGVALEFLNADLFHKGNLVTLRIGPQRCDARADPRRL